MHFDEGRLATTCGYCGSDAYRAALAEAARSDAAASESSSRKQLRAAVAEIRSSRHEIGGYFLFVGFADVFYMVVFAVMSLGDYVFG